MGGRRSAAVSLLALALLGIYAGSLLAIGLTRDWRLLHEDNGALHSTFALSHIRLGIERTRAHDLFFDPRTGRGVVYGHHPPGVALLVAAAFALTGSDAPWVARLVPIAFHLGSVFLMVRLLARVVPWTDAVVGGVLMATLPMGSYFGRMVNYEAPGLFAALLQLNGYAACKQGRSREGWLMLCGGTLFGGLVDWAPLFFAAAIALAEIGLGARWGRRSRGVPAAALASALAVAAFDVWHLSFAAHGSPPLIDGVMASQWPASWRAIRPTAFALSQAEVTVHYFTRSGLIAEVLAVCALLDPRAETALDLAGTGDGDLLKRLLAISGGAAGAYVLAAPSWAQVHAYWQFYALPFVITSMVLFWRALRRVAAGRHRAIGRLLLCAFVVEVIWTSASTLHYRHSTPSAHAIRQTAEFRANYLAPLSRGVE
jgi:hypothetical protein